MLIAPQIASAAKQKSGGGGKAAHAGGGGGGGMRAAHVGGGGAVNRAGGGQRSNNLHVAGQTAHTQHGLNANRQSAQHGLNSRQGTRQGLNARAGSGLQGHHAGKWSGAQARGNRFATRSHSAAHWRSGLHYRNTHALYAGYHRVWHDRGWWRGHYNDVVYVGGPYWGGNWYWDGGYWLPAWGYDPAFAGYVYDGPIFAYNNLPPDEVVINIQEALQDQGYYTGNIDGQLGKQTQDALAAYQRDHELEVTAAIDEPTVQSLGLVTEES